MPPTTRSQTQPPGPAAAATADFQQVAVSEDGYVTLNWVFFDRSNAQENPCAIDVPHALFNAHAEKCRDFFTVTLKEKHQFEVEKTAIEFWKPKELLMVDTVGEPEWINSIDDKSFRESFQKLIPTRSFAKSVTGQDNQDAVHLIITTNHVTLNWVFFDRLSPQDNVRPINIPRPLFNQPAEHCVDLFAAALKEKYDFEAEKNTIQIWKPKELLFMDTVGESEWTNSLDDEIFHASFQKLILARNLAKSVAEQDNEDAVHLIVVARGTYQQSVEAEEHQESQDVVPELGEIRRYRAIVETYGKSPSVGAKSTEYVSVQSNLGEVVHDGRHGLMPPFATVAPPVQIFHPIFETFTRLVEDASVQPDHNDLIATQELMHFLSTIGKEAERNPQIRARLSKILEARIHELPNDDKSSADGIHMCEVDGVHIPFFINELKREFGEGGCDASLQAGISMRRSWRQSDRAVIRNKCCCPTLMLVGGGPWIGVLGGVITDKLIVQRLTDMLWVGHSSTAEDPRVYRFARMLVALRECIKKLSAYYRSLHPIEEFSFKSGSTHPRFYPYPDSFTEEGKVVKFAYVKMLEDDPACVTYQAKISDADPGSPDIVVKFVARYGKDVHEFLAKQSYAPRLRYCGPLQPRTHHDDLPVNEGLSDHSLLPYANTVTPSRPSREDIIHLPSSHANAPPGLSLGSMQIIVMDYIPTCKKPPANAREQVAEVLKYLRSEGYVLGDLRRQNVLFDKYEKVKIIDLDWSGRHKMPYDKDDDRSYVRYPLNISKSVKWADGVKDFTPILPEHDQEMLEMMDLSA